jgi:hypothetical protein
LVGLIAYTGLLKIPINPIPYVFDLAVLDECFKYKKALAITKAF